MWPFVNLIASPPASLETQRTQSSSIFSFAAERPANENPQSLREVYCSTTQGFRDDASIQYDLARRAVVFHFLASQQKVKRRIYSESSVSLR